MEADFHKQRAYFDTQNQRMQSGPLKNREIAKKDLDREIGFYLGAEIEIVGNEKEEKEKRSK